MGKKALNTQEKIHNCLFYLDKNMEKQQNQSLSVTETIIQDIKQLTQDYQMAMKKSQLVEHIDTVHSTQMKWVKQLQALNLNNTDLETSSKVISALHKFANNLNKTNLDKTELKLPNGLEEPVNQPVEEIESQLNQNVFANNAFFQLQKPPSHEHH